MLSPNFQDKLIDTFRFIQRITLDYKNPVILWSGGKDSMVMLNILRTRSLPVILYRHPEFPEKYEFADRIIKDWGLDIYEFKPYTVRLQDVNGTTEMVWCYKLSESRFIMLPTNMLPIDEDKPFKCGLTFKADPTQIVNFPWDVMFIGHKSCDVDPTRGSVELHTQLKVNEQCADLAFPLKDWTHEDIWEYSKEYDVPIQDTRYEQIDGKWQEKTDKTLNPDCLPICIRCVDKNDRQTVRCSILKCDIPNLSSTITYLEDPQFDYFGAQKEVVHA